MDDTHRQVANAFHTIYYHHARGEPLRRAWEDTYWLGMRVHKNPMDLWNYQEIMTRLRPRVIVETGVHMGGSILYYATMGMLTGVEQVIGIDIKIFDTAAPLRQLTNVTLIEGSSTDPDVVDQVRGLVAGRSALVILDSDHARDHVLQEMRLYHEFVPMGGYLIVEDSNVNSHPVYPQHGPGPFEAIDLFLAENDQFEIDTYRCEKFYLTFNPNGYLKRVKENSNCSR